MFTLIKGFENLNAAEIKTLTDAPLLITLLVGAADGKFDREERTWAGKLVETRTYSKPLTLNEYYRVVSNNFLEKTDTLMAQLPSDVASRNAAISSKLMELNQILPKLDGHLAYYLYNGFLKLAEETANASGGFLRIGAVSAAEYAWVKLPMVHKIAKPADLPVTEEEEEEIED